jgi:hypothetical protein
MKKSLLLQITLAAAFLILTISCGGSSSSNDSSSNETAGGGIGGSGTMGASSGAIEGFGSVFVNGVEWETTGTEFEIEGVGGFTENDLHEGMRVTVEGTFDDNGTTGTATRIRFDDNLEGPISSVTTSSSGSVKTLVVMGQTAIVEDGVTFFDNNDPAFTFAALGPGNVGNVVEISGSTNFDGSIRTTYIERKADDLATFLLTDDLEIEGVVENLAGNTFQINLLTVDFTGVIPRNGVLADGVTVEVKGNNLVGNTLTAMDVEIKPAGLGLDDIDKAEVEGFVTDLNTGAKTFKIDGQPVDYATAEFIGGTEAELLEGIEVEAEGPIVLGTLVAVTVKYEDSVKFEANVATKDVGAGTLTLEGFAGITIQVDDVLTEFDGVADLNGIDPGDNLKIRGRVSDTGPGSTTVSASEIELISTTPDTRAIVQGTVDSFSPPPPGGTGIVTILGVVDVNTNTINDDDFEDGDISIGRDEFFRRLNNGDLVKARLDLTSGDWDQIEFED